MGRVKGNRSAIGSMLRPARAAAYSARIVMCAFARVALACLLVFGCCAPSLFTTAVEVAYAADDADQKAADKVAKMIEELPDPAAVQASHRAAYEKAKEAYDKLAKKVQELIKKELRQKLEKLGPAIEQAEQAEAEAAAAAAQEAADKAAAQAVADLIDALPAASAAKAADEATAQAAKTAYAGLTDAQKAYVDAGLVAKIDAVIAAAQAAAKADADKGKQNQDASGSSSDPGSSSSQSPAASDSSASSSASEPSGEEEGNDGVDPNGTYYVDTLLLKWDKADEFGEKHFVGDSSIVEADYKKVSIDEYGETVQLTGWYASTDGTGVIYQAGDSTTRIGSFDLSWKSSDEDIATVTPSGLVKPRGKNGSVTITATVADKNVYKGKAPTATVTIVFDGQDGKYVEKVEILDEDGNVIGEDWGGVTVYQEENAFHQLQARVTWRDAKTDKTSVQVTGTGDTYNAKDVDTTIAWNVSSSTAFTINKDTGRLRCGSYSGNAYVTCTVVGGKGGAEVSDTANVQLDTGVYEYNPANSLTLRVVWEERPDEVVKEETYSYADLLAMLSSQHVNATVVNASRYGVISADGFLFKDVVNLVAVDDADVLQYRFTTADGYDNPVSYQYLFESGPRYYFPNYDLGGSTAGGQIVAPILAYQSTFEWNRSQANPNAKMDEGTRFRLVFGCLGAGDANTSFQIYYINAITVVLKGGPSAGGQGGDGAGDESGTDGGQGGGENGGGQDGQGGEGGGKNGASDEGGADNAADGASNRQSVQAGAEPTAGRGENASGGETDKQEQEAEAAEGADVGSSKRWRVYQMMNKNNSDVPDWDDENPISPFAAPVAIGAFAIGMGATGIGFRRRLK